MSITSSNMGAVAGILYRERPQTKRVIIHCSHTDPGIGQLYAYLQAEGRRRGLLDVGYHYIIERDGWMTVCREWEAMGSHAPGSNHDSIGICLANEGHGEQPKGEQTRTLRHLIHAIRGKFGVGVVMVGHDEASRYKPGSREPCPGFDMDKLREDCILPPHHLHEDHDEHRMDDDGGPHPGLSTQCRMILDYLQAGRTLTNMIALNSLGIGSLSSRVAQLRSAGYDVRADSKLDYNNRRYNSYYLEH